MFAPDDNTRKKHFTDCDKCAYTELNSSIVPFHRFAHIHKQLLVSLSRLISIASSVASLQSEGRGANSNFQRLLRSLGDIQSVA